MNSYDEPELLGHLEPVDPPPFLFTRIEARLKERYAARAPRSWIAVAGVFAAALLVLNLLAIRNAAERRVVNGPADIAAGFGMNDSNQLYQ